jgi:glycosyltransferase involved in cell wall biosynthesis
LKIIQVLNSFLPEETAGTEVYVWALSKELQQLNATVEVMMPNHGKSMTEIYSYDKIKVFKYAEPSVIDRDLIMGRKTPDGLVNFIAYINEIKPDIIHFHEISGSNGITLHHVLAAKKSGAKVIMTFHLARYTCKTGTLMYLGKNLCDGKIDISKCSKCFMNSKGTSIITNAALILSSVLYNLNVNVSTWNNKMGTALGTHGLQKVFQINFNFLIANCDKVVTLTDWYKNILIRNGVNENKIKTIKQGLVYKSSVTMSATSSQNNKILRIIFLGRISHFKGLHLLIDAIKHLPSHQLSLHIYGQSTKDQTYEMKLKEETANNSNIHWMGKLNPENVLSTLQQFDVLCLSSTFSEMSPLVIQEAFAAGIPVIASNVYGNAEQIQHEENGLLFDFNNSHSLGLQIKRLLEEPLLLTTLKQHISKPKSFEKIGEEYWDLYEEVMKNQ